MALEKAALLGLDLRWLLKPVVHSEETVREVNAGNEAAYGVWTGD
jgi:hypothetical protein